MNKTKSLTHIGRLTSDMCQLHSVEWRVCLPLRSDRTPFFFLRKRLGGEAERRRHLPGSCFLCPHLPRADGALDGKLKCRTNARGSMWNWYATRTPFDLGQRSICRVVGSAEETGLTICFTHVASTWGSPDLCCTMHPPVPASTKNRICRVKNWRQKK